MRLPRGAQPWDAVASYCRCNASTSPFGMDAQSGHDDDHVHPCNRGAFTCSKSFDLNRPGGLPRWACFRTAGHAPNSAHPSHSGRTSLGGDGGNAIAIVSARRAKATRLSRDAISTLVMVCSRLFSAAVARKLSGGGTASSAAASAATAAAAAEASNASSGSVAIEMARDATRPSRRTSAAAAAASRRAATEAARAEAVTAGPEAAAAIISRCCDLC